MSLLRYVNCARRRRAETAMPRLCVSGAIFARSTAFAGNGSGTADKNAEPDASGTTHDPIVRPSQRGRVFRSEQPRQIVPTSLPTPTTSSYSAITLQVHYNTVMTPIAITACAAVLWSCAAAAVAADASKDALVAPADGPSLAEMTQIIESQGLLSSAAPLFDFFGMFADEGPVESKCCANLPRSATDAPEVARNFRGLVQTSALSIRLRRQVGLNILSVSQRFSRRNLCLGFANRLCLQNDNVVWRFETVGNIKKKRVFTRIGY